MLPYMFYSGKGEHSVNVLEKMIEDRNEYILKTQIQHQEMKQLLEEIRDEAILNGVACDHELLSKIETVIKKTKGS